MRIIVSKSVIDSAANTQGVVKLHRLLAFACVGRHALLANPVDGFNTWLKTLDEPTRSAYQTALNLSERSALALAHNVATIRIENPASRCQHFRREYQVAAP